jgi:hypothetical protein
MENNEIKEYENACNKIFPGLQMFVRDTFLEKETEDKYEIGKIIREPTFCDVSCRVGGLITTHRYAVLSNHFVSFEFLEQDTNWGLFVCKRNSYFKILDVYKLNDKTQISLLHLDDNWKLFENTKSNVEEDIVNMSQERFRNKVNTPPIPELATKRWLERLMYPIGIDYQNNYFSLTVEEMKETNPETEQTIQNMDNVIEKALKEEYKP